MARQNSSRTPTAQTTTPKSSPARRSSAERTAAATDAPASLSRAGEGRDIPAEEIAVRAYDIWCRRGRPDGSAQEDWFQAERELGAARST
jgi:hypothetical protein